MCKRLLAAVLSAVLAAAGAAAAAVKDGDTWGDWRAACPAPREGAKPSCYIFQNIAAEKTGARVLHIAVGRVAAQGGKPAAILTLPLGLSLPPGITLVIEGHKTQKLPYDVCVAEGCKTGLPLDDKTLAALRKAYKAHVLLTEPGGQQVRVGFSLNGFAAAFDALSGVAP
jgi:invasion protein IalB